MRIGQLSKETDCKIETVRYYEKIGLMPEPPRTEGGYRIYDKDGLKRLLFIRRSRKLGFAIEEIRALLRLVDGGGYSCSDIKEIALEHINSIHQKILYLNRLEKSLSRIASRCSGNTAPECPIIDALYLTRKSELAGSGKMRKTNTGKRSK